MKIQRVEHGGKGQEVKGIVGGESLQQSAVRGKGGWMTNDVRESGGNEINFSSSKAYLTSQRKRAAVLPHYQTKHTRNTTVTDEGNQTQKSMIFEKIYFKQNMKIVCANVLVFLQLQTRATSDRWGKTLQVRSTPSVTSTCR